VPFEDDEYRVNLHNTLTTNDLFIVGFSIEKHVGPEIFTPAPKQHKLSAFLNNGPQRTLFESAGQFSNNEYLQKKSDANWRLRS
jgi:hypothetical protein